MKIRRILFIFIFVLIATFVIGCDENLSKGEKYNISLTQVEHATFKVVNREESVLSAHEGQKLFVSIVFEQGYELDKVYVNNKGIEGTSFVMPKSDVNVTISVKEIISNISITQSSGGTISCDKTQAKYGEKIYITVTPEQNYYVNSKGLKVNSAEVSISPIYTKTTFEFVMPHTDINISANFIPPTIFGGKNFGDYDYSILGRNSGKWNYTLEEDNNEVSISLKGTGDGAKQRDVAYTFYKEKSNYFYFSTEVQITNFSISSTYENRVGIFLGDGSKMGTIGYYFKKYTSSTDLLIGRKYTSLTFDSGYRTAITGFQNIMIGEPGLSTSDTLSNGTVPTSCGGKANISKNEFSNIVMKIGIIYDGINHKLHILLGLEDEELKYVRTIDTNELNYGEDNSSEPKYFNLGEDGSVNFGLYAEAAHEMSFKFFGMEYSTDKNVIETRFPEIKGQ